MAQIPSSIEEVPDVLNGRPPLAGPETIDANYADRTMLVGLDHRSALMDARQQIYFSKDRLPEAHWRSRTEVSAGRDFFASGGRTADKSKLETVSGPT